MFINLIKRKCSAVRHDLASFLFFSKRSFDSASSFLNLSLLKFVPFCLVSFVSPRAALRVPLRITFSSWVDFTGFLLRLARAAAVFSLPKRGSHLSLLIVLECILLLRHRFRYAHLLSSA